MREVHRVEHAECPHHEDAHQLHQDCRHGDLERGAARLRQGHCRHDVDDGGEGGQQVRQRRLGKLREDLVAGPGCRRNREDGIDSNQQPSRPGVAGVGRRCAVPRRPPRIPRPASEAAPASPFRAGILRSRFLPLPSQYQIWFMRAAITRAVTPTAARTKLLQRVRSRMAQYTAPIGRISAVGQIAPELPGLPRDLLAAGHPDNRTDQIDQEGKFDGGHRQYRRVVGRLFQDARDDADDAGEQANHQNDVEIRVHYWPACFSLAAFRGAFPACRCRAFHCRAFHCPARRPAQAWRSFPRRPAGPPAYRPARTPLPACPRSLPPACRRRLRRRFCGRRKSRWSPPR